MWHPRSETIHFSSQSTALTSYSAHCARGQKGNVRVPQSMVCEDGTGGAREKHCVCTDTFGTEIKARPRIESPAEGAHCAYGGWGWRAGSCIMRSVRRLRICFTA